MTSVPWGRSNDTLCSVNGSVKGKVCLSNQGNFTWPPTDITLTLFVFSTDDPKQIAGSLLTPVSSIVTDALSHGTLGFAFHGSFNNHLFQRIRLAVEEPPPI